MKKDFKNEKLLDAQLADVQGGTQQPDSTMHIICQYPGCGWTFHGPDAEAMAAEQEHRNTTGHNKFTAWSERKI